MKLKIMIMALLLMSAGIGSAVNWLPESTMYGKMNMTGHDIVDINLTDTDYLSGTQLLGNMDANGYDLIDAGLPREYVRYVGSTTWADYVSDGDDVQVEINAAVNYFAERHSGGVIVLLPGNYNITGQVTLNSFVLLCGVNTPYTSNWGPQPSFDHPDISRLLVRYNTTSPIRLIGVGSGVRDIGIVYPDQNTNSAPIEYPAAITVHNSKHNIIERINFYNSYIGVDASRSHECLLWRDCVGYPLYKGGVIGNSTDVDRIYNNHWNPNTCNFAGTDFDLIDPVLYNWVHGNGVAWEIHRADGIEFHHNFAINYNKGIYFTGPFGVWRGRFSHNYLDEIGAYGIDFSGADSGAIMYLTHFDGNDILCNSGNGFRFSNKTVQCVFIGNTLDCKHHGMFISDSDQSIFSLNEIREFGDGTILCYGIYVNGAYNMICHNQIHTDYTNTTSIRYDGGGVATENICVGMQYPTVSHFGAAVNITENNLSP